MSTAKHATPSHELDRELMSVYAELREMAPKLISPDGGMRPLPADPRSLLRTILEELKKGGSISIVENDTSVTTVEAARMLGMSRQFLIGLLEKGEIEHHKVGTHRRMYVRDVLAYKVKRDTARRKAIDAMAQAEFNEGTYGLVPDDFHAGK